MSEIPKPALDFDENLAKFPDLARARQLYIALFKDRTPLVNLGYTNKQIEYSIPILRLVEEEGRIETQLGNPYPSLLFHSDDSAEFVSIDYLLN